MVVSMLLSSIAGNTSLFDWVVSVAFCPQPAAMRHKTSMAIAFVFFMMGLGWYLNTNNTDFVWKSYSYVEKNVQNFNCIDTPAQGWSAPDGSGARETVGAKLNSTGFLPLIRS